MASTWCQMKPTLHELDWHLQSSLLFEYQRTFALQAMAHQEQTLRRAQLFAIYGAPPGLSNEYVKRCEGHVSACRPASRSSVESDGDAASIASDMSTNLSRIAARIDSRTTITIRNLNGCTRQMLLNFIDRHGFEGKYNLVYLPLYFRNGRSFPFGFINFSSESVAMEFQACMQGYEDPDMFGDQTAEVSWSECQGLQANIENYQNSSVMHPSVGEEFKPLLFKNGQVIPFPEPTKPLRRLRKVRKPNGRQNSNHMLHQGDSSVSVCMS